MFRNQELAVELDRPSCQDTGVLQFWVKCGTGFPLINELEGLLKETVVKATFDAPLCHDSVETFDEYNTGKNVGRGTPTVWWDIVYLTGGLTTCRDEAHRRVVEETARAEWRDLGMPETLWNCRVREFGPLIVSIDSEGRNYFEEKKAELQGSRSCGSAAVRSLSIFKRPNSLMIALKSQPEIPQRKTMR